MPLNLQVGLIGEQSAAGAQLDSAAMQDNVA